MKFYSFYGCAALLFGSSLMVIGDRVFFHVKSMKCKNYSEGPGILAYHSPRHLVYLGEKYKGYKTTMEMLKNPRCNDDDPLPLHLHHVAKQNERRKSVKSAHAYPLELIGSYTRCDGDGSLTLQHADEAVKITFSDVATCAAFAEYFHDNIANGNSGYNIILED